MKVVMIVGSPKSKKSTSEIVLNSLSERLSAATVDWIYAADYSIEVAENSNETTASPGDAADYSKDNPLEEKDDALFEKILENDVIVFAFPLYIDSIPSHLLRFLEAMECRYRNHIMNTKVYCIVNSGFFDPRNTEIAIDMIKLWSAHSGLIFGQALALGGGGMGRAASIGEGPLESYGKALDDLADNIYADVGGETIFTSPDIEKSDYMADANKAWKAAAKKRGVSSWSLRNKSTLD